MVTKIYSTLPRDLIYFEYLTSVVHVVDGFGFCADGYWKVEL